MESIIVLPKDKAEAKLLTDLLAKMNVITKVINNETTEDLGLLALLKEADRSEKVSRKEIMEKLQFDAG